MASTTTVLDPSTSDDQTSITWHDPLYPHVLNRYTVMHYFEFSSFFDRNSNNMLARRQNLDPAVPGVLDSLPPGIEYVVEVEQAPHLFVIRKQQRREDKKDAAAAAAMAAGGPGAGAGGPLTLAHYYVLDKMVYQAPTLHAALATRLRRCVWSLQEGFTRLKRDLDPLQKLLRDEQKRKRQLEQQQQQQQQQQQEHKADAGGAAAAASDPAAEAAAEAAAAVQAVAASAAHAGGDRVEEEAGPVAKGYSAEEERRWRKASNIIDSVLSQFPLPKMPPEYYNTPQQQQQQQQLQQQQEDAKKPQADEGPSPTGAAAATTAPATGAAAVPPRAPTPVGGGAATPQAVAPAAAVAPAPASKRSRQR